MSGPTDRRRSAQRGGSARSGWLHPRSWRKAQAAEREEWGSEYADPTDADGIPYHLVFTRENGEPLDPGKTYATFVRLVRDAGLADQVSVG